MYRYDHAKKVYIRERPSVNGRFFGGRFAHYRKSLAFTADFDSCAAVGCSQSVFVFDSPSWAAFAWHLPLFICVLRT
jgi:hypothetical protein